MMYALGMRMGRWWLDRTIPSRRRPDVTEWGDCIPEMDRTRAARLRHQSRRDLEPPRPPRGEYVEVPYYGGTVRRYI